MKEAGQSLLNGGILIIGFIILVVVLTSLPGGQPDLASSPAAPPASTQPVAPQPVSPVPSTIRGARQAAPPQASTTTTTGQTSNAFGQRRRRDLPQPRESAAEMENRIRRYLDK